MENIVPIKRERPNGLLAVSSPFGTMSMKAFADSIGVAKSTIYTWKTNGEIPADCFKEVGGKIFVKVKEMRAFFAS